MRRRALLMGCLLWCGAVGCAKQDSAGRLPISGKVTLKGALLDRGAIQFMPAESGGQFGSGGVIANGEYTIPGSQGLPPGRYKVLISSGVAGPELEQGKLPGEAGPPAEERIPPEFNVHSDKFVDVAAGKQNAFDFEIP